MSDSAFPVPSYRRHKPSGQAVVSLPNGIGGRHDIYLGKYGSKASRIAYAVAIAEWEARGRRTEQPTVGPSLSVNELIEAYMGHAAKHYRRPDGTPTNELNDIRLSMKPLKTLYGLTPAAKFGPLALEAVRNQMIAADICRNVVNQRVGRIKRMFRWGVSKELIPATVVVGIDTVAGLQAGRSEARETEPIKPIAEWVVDATLPHVLPPVAAMARLQQLTGARPGECCSMRACDLDTTGRVWLYRPYVHKLSHKGKDRVVAIGPRRKKSSASS